MTLLKSASYSDENAFKMGSCYNTDHQMLSYDAICYISMNISRVEIDSKDCHVEFFQEMLSNSTSMEYLA